MNRQQLISTITSHNMDIFRINDLRKLFPDEANLKVTVKRMIDTGIIIPVARGIYTLKEESLDIENIATRLYYPSYISFESALSKYGIINQGLYGLTLATTRHSKKMILAGVDCEYCQIKGSLYTGYTLTNGTYLASPEKALLDLLYLHALGKRTINPTEWITDALNPKEIRGYLTKYPPAVENMVKELGLWK